MKQAILWIIVLSIVTAGCTPVGRAKARRIDAETRRANRIHDLYMERENALTAVKVESKANGIRAVSIIVIIFAAGLAVAWLLWIFGWIRTDIKRRELAASLIPPNPVTHQYPAFIHETKGRHYLVTPNLIGGVIPLDKALSYDQALADSDTRVKIAGLLPNPRVLSKSKIIDG